MYFTTSAPNFLWGDCFQIFTKNRPQKHQKRAILHTSQANEGGSIPPAPPWLRYFLGVPTPPLKNFSDLKKTAFFVTFKGDHTIRFSSNLKKYRKS